MSIVMLLSAVTAPAAWCETIANVRTGLQLVGSSERIVIEAFDDPKIAGVVCYVSYLSPGGVTERTGLSVQQQSDLSCQRVSTITLPKEVIEGRSDGEEVFNRDGAFNFKAMQVLRFYDQRRRTLVYLGYSSREGSGSLLSTVAVDVDDKIKAGP